MKKLVLSLLLATLALSGQSAKFSGKDALKYTEALTQFGPRPSGTPELDHARKFIEASLASWKLKPEIDSFLEPTPVGKLPMYNYIVKFPGKGDKVIMIAGHYDTKRFKEFKFLGANDGGSSAGVLLELARVLSLSPKKADTVWIVFHDGEEAQEGPWTATDSLHGSRHLAAKLQASGEVKKIKALINIDMIGNKNLSILRDTNSAGWLNNLVREQAAAIGLGKIFNGYATEMEDDHLPYIAAGVPSVDLIDFTSADTFWHKAGDTTDKLSADSMEAVGRVLLASIDAIGKRP
jgi:Zn-dependent M28 family amino/carboxypeptidase